LDLLSAFRGTRDAYALRDTHWNASGNQIAAREIAAWLKKDRLVGGPGLAGISD